MGTCTRVSPASLPPCPSASPEQTRRFTFLFPPWVTIPRFPGTDPHNPKEAGRVSQVDQLRPPHLWLPAPLHGR